MMDSRVRPTYENLLKVAEVALCRELCELYLNQARGLVDYGLMCEDMTGAEFEREMQRINQARITRETRRAA